MLVAFAFESFIHRHLLNRVAQFARPIEIQLTSKSTVLKLEELAFLQQEVLFVVDGTRSRIRSLMSVSLFRGILFSSLLTSSRVAFALNGSCFSVFLLISRAISMKRRIADPFVITFVHFSIVDLAKWSIGIRYKFSKVLAFRTYRHECILLKKLIRGSKAS